jgi:hypothetical protein
VLLLLIIAVIVGIVAWCAIDAPNARSPSPQRREREMWG